ncbi:suppressor-of-stellate-like protein [Drosophila busckii]|uniref:suppressor-of-stellate-like protein n=1 Tax=Drosophila busckii TaxID=30019 RepID=UPI001432D266|nr:suppressor-of-stellate-like protein [Drosophila busckii]
MSHRYCSASHDGSWISWFLSLPMNEFLCRVPVDYIQDRFNLTGLDAQLGSQLSDALDLVLESEFDTECFQQVETDLDAAAKLYGLIHARYILTARGIDDMCMKYQRGDFGKCPRLYCHSQLMLPVGVSDRFGESHVKLYCARCRDIYQPQAHCAMLDGANFGRSFPQHVFSCVRCCSVTREQIMCRAYLGFVDLLDDC